MHRIMTTVKYGTQSIKRPVISDLPCEQSLNLGTITEKKTMSNIFSPECYSDRGPGYLHLIAD